MASAPSRGQAPSYAPTYAFDVFGAYLESLRVQAGIPGLAAAVVGEDSVLWEHAYGRQDLNRAIVDGSVNHSDAIPIKRRFVPEPTHELRAFGRQSKCDRNHVSF